MDPDDPFQDIPYPNADSIKAKMDQLKTLTPKQQEDLLAEVDKAIAASSSNAALVKGLVAVRDIITAIF